MRRVPTLRVAGDLKGHDREVHNTNVLRTVHLHRPQAVLEGLCRTRRARGVP